MQKTHRRLNADCIDAHPEFTLKETAIPHPSDTITFGEKKHTSPHYYMDLLELGRKLLRLR
jgi:hypothetical protein